MIDEKLRIRILILSKILLTLRSNNQVLKMVKATLTLLKEVSIQLNSKLTISIQSMTFRSKIQVRNLEYFATIKKEDGVVKISSLFIKKKIIPSFARITNEEIKFSGATKEEFLTFLKDRGARKIKNKHDVLERI